MKSNIELSKEKRLAVLQKAASSFNMRVVLGLLFMFASGIMIPGIIYSCIVESDKGVYISIAAFIFSFFLIGIGILISGIKDMIKQKRNEEWD